MLMLLLMAPVGARADQVETVNGDRYTGRVVSLNADTLVLQSDVLGTLRVPRGKVSIILLGSNTVARSTGATSLTTGNVPGRPAASVTDFNTALRQLGTNTALIQQVQNQFLAGAGPEATGKFNELLGGLMNGSLTLTDLRAQAKSSADTLRALKRDLGEDGWAVDSYLSILDGFVKETEASVPAGITNAPAKKP